MASLQPGRPRGSKGPPWASEGPWRGSQRLSRGSKGQSWGSKGAYLPTTQKAKQSTTSFCSFHAAFNRRGWPWVDFSGSALWPPSSLGRPGVHKGRPGPQKGRGGARNGCPGAQKGTPGAQKGPPGAPNGRLSPRGHSGPPSKPESASASERAVFLYIISYNTSHFGPFLLQALLYLLHAATARKA